MPCYSSKIWGNNTAPCLEMLLIYHVLCLLGCVCLHCRDISAMFLCVWEREERDTMRYVLRTLEWVSWQAILQCLQDEAFCCFLAEAKTCNNSESSLEQQLSCCAFCILCMLLHSVIYFLFLYWLARAATTKCHRLGGLNIRNLFSHSSGDEKSKIGVASFWGLSSRFADGCPPAVFSLVSPLWVHTSGVAVHPNFLLLQG